MQVSGLTLKPNERLAAYLYGVRESLRLARDQSGFRELLEPQGKCRYRHEVDEAKGHEDAQR